MRMNLFSSCWFTYFTCWLISWLVCCRFIGWFTLWCWSISFVFLFIRIRATCLICRSIFDCRPCLRRLRGFCTLVVRWNLWRLVGSLCCWTRILLRLRFCSILLRIFASLIMGFHGSEAFTFGLFVSCTSWIIITLFVLLVAFCNSRLFWTFCTITWGFDQLRILAIFGKDFAYKRQNQSI